MQLRGPHLVSLAILAGIAGWMVTGDLILGGQADPKAQSIVERKSESTGDVFRVSTVVAQPSERISKLTIRGRTKANGVVSVRAETGGTVQKRLVEKGQQIAAGDLLCVIDKGVRNTGLQQSQALLEQTQADYDANLKLVQRGFQTKSRLRQLKAAMDSAKASLATAQQDMSRTEIRATASGIVQEPLAEVGDNLAPGGVCTTLMNADPMLFTGQVSEQDIGKVDIGMEAQIKLVSGETVTGKVAFISTSADAQTRTFNTEIAVPNSDYAIRDGLTAEAEIDLKPTQAYKVEAAWLTLADDGQIGLRVVGEDNLVAFVPVNILLQDETTMWVDGLTPGAEIITLGQNFVIAGQKVQAVPADKAKSEATPQTTPAKEGASS